MVPKCQATSGYKIMAVLFISICRLLSLAQTLDTADPLFALLITLDLYLHHVEVADQARPSS